MKNIVLIILMVFLCSACEDFLVEDPRGNLSADQYFNTEEEALTGIYGVYFRLNNGLIHSSLINTLNIGSDHFFTPRAVMFGGMVHGIYYGLGTFDVRIQDYWVQLYRGIRDANMVISRVQNSGLEEEEKALLVGETKFLRAMYYYYLATLWGDVPYWTEELQIDVVSHISNTSAETILNDMLADLDEAESVLPETTWGGSGGRATKWAAKMLKARIYLWQHDYANAKTEASEIINQSPHVLLPHFGDIFKASNERNDEIIFGVEFKEDAVSSVIPNQYRPQGNYEKHINPKPSWFNGIAAWTLYQSFIDLYEPGDIRRKYTVLDSINGQKTNYNYCLKYMEVPLPEDDPTIDPSNPLGKLNSGRDDIYFRLAETYLMLAEAENELNGPTSVAYDAVNEIRNRAQLPDLPAGMSQEELREAIRLEIGKELVGEHRGRKHDLLRWGILDETVAGLPAKEATSQQQAFVRPIYKTRATYYANICATNYSEKWNYFPIPGAEIQRNPNLVQHPLWQ
ncbi:MAG TPA: RagB/SusD family nutrient uptake outer membrane protein [Bacteroidetes bacterium]|nr:RagB/SusD family nutrient uptake outer membrane protein [Bacteroidota bacterium]